MELKAKKLPELQELAKALGVPKFRSLKKLDLVYQILDYQASNPNAVKAVVKVEKAPPVKQQPKKEKESQSVNKPHPQRGKRTQSHPRKTHQQNVQQQGTKENLKSDKEQKPIVEVKKQPVKQTHTKDNKQRNPNQQIAQ